MDWTGLLIGAGLLVGGFFVKTWLIPFYVKHVDNRKIYSMVFLAARKADEYGEKKLGKDNFDALENTLAATAMTAALAACDGSKIDADALLQTVKANRQ